jgi:hypothetical protein
MFIRQVSVGIGALICIGFGLALPHHANIVGAQTSDITINFDQVFADAKMDCRELTTACGAIINGTRKGDRLTTTVVPVSIVKVTVILRNVNSQDSHNAIDRRTILPTNNAAPSSAPTPALLRHCEPVAAPYADPALSQIIGRCFV